MRKLQLRHSALGLCVAAVSLAACGGSFNALSGATAVVPATVRVTAPQDNAFIANYSGTYKTVRKRIHGNNYQITTLDGSGTASFLGRSRETGTLYVSCAVGCGGSGILKLRSLQHPKTVVFMKVTVGYWCPAYYAQYTVKRGKGRLVGATGSGTVTFTCSDSKASGSGAYSDQWSGTLYE